MTDLHLLALPAAQDGIRPFIGPDGRPTIAVSYDVVYDPVETGMPSLPPDVRESAAELMQGDMAVALPVLADLAERYPDVPAVKNWLVVALEATGQWAAAIMVAEEMAAAFPDYLFGRTYRATRLLEQGRTDDVPAVLGGMELKLVYPHRTKFHITEVLAFTAVLCEYWLQKGDDRSALFYLDRMVTLAPDHPLTKQCLDQARDLLMAVAAELAAADPPPDRKFRQGSHTPKKDRNRKRRR